MDDKNKRRSPEYWTLERCQHFARKYKSIEEWIEKSPLSYEIAKTNNWINSIVLNQKKKKYSYKECLAIAMKYSSIKDWKKQDRRMYNYTASRGWIKKCSKAMGVSLPFPRGYNWTIEECFKYGKKFSSRKNWERGHISSFAAAYKNKWLDQIMPFKTWTKDECYEYLKKYKGFRDWRKNHYKSFAFAKKNKWIPEMKIKLGYKKTKPLGYWTYDRCKKEGLRFTYMNQWMKKGPGSYKAARTNGWLKELSKHFVSPVKRPWTKAQCVRDAKKYKKRSIWHDNNQSAYVAAKRNGWLDECTKHMTLQEQDLREKKVVKLLMKRIKKEITKNVEIERMIGSSLNFPDLTIMIGNKVIFVEVKHHLSFWAKQEIKDQIKRYSYHGKREHGKKFLKCMLCSPNGRYGHSFDHIIKELKNII